METLIILTFPTYIFGQIKIEVSCENRFDRNVNYYGNSMDIISDTERSSFNITDENLKRFVKINFGLKPNAVFLNEPTPWGDLYSIYNWKPVTRSLIPHKAQVISFSSTPTTVLTQVFNNTTWNKATFKAPIRQQVNNTIRSYWEKTRPLTVSEDILYTFNMTSPSFSGRLLSTYTSRWGEDLMISESVTAGSQTAVRVVLRPKQTVVADLIAMRDIVKVQIHYVASLLGSTVVNYNRGYRGHHFWSLDINSVLESGGVPIVLPSTEVIIMDYYTDSKVIVRDVETKKVLDTVEFNLHKA